MRAMLATWFKILISDKKGLSYLKKPKNYRTAPVDIKLRTIRS
jgi:hypothetical protein